MNRRREEDLTLGDIILDLLLAALLLLAWCALLLLVIAWLSPNE